MLVVVFYRECVGDVQGTEGRGGQKDGRSAAESVALNWL